MVKDVFSICTRVTGFIDWLYYTLINWKCLKTRSWVYFNSVWPGGAIWWHICWSILAQIMACSLWHPAITWTSVDLSSVWFSDYPTLAREFQCFKVWGKFVFRTLELTDTPTNLANEFKVGHALDQSRSVQSRGPERAYQNNEPSWRSARTDRRLWRQFWND